MKTFSIAEKLLSWKERIQVFGGDGEVAYEATWSYSFPTETWDIVKDDIEVATLQRRWLAWTPTWDVTMESTDFELRRNWLSLRRQTVVVGGPFDGAMLTGSLLDYSFELTRFGRPIAHADAALMSMRDRIGIQLVKDDPASELFTIVMMVNVMMQRGSRGGQDETMLSSLIGLLLLFWRNDR